MMKYVFVLVLLLVGGIAGVQGVAILYRWNHDMIETQRVMPGEMNFAMAPGSLPRTGSQLYYSKEQREAASLRKNPVPPRPESIKKGGDLYVVYCTPATALRQGPTSRGPFGFPLSTNAALHTARTDGTGRVPLGRRRRLPSYSESLSAEYRWHLVNYLRRWQK